MKDPSIAILVFSQPADQEVRRKKWIGQERVSLQLIRKWNHEARKVAMSTGLPFFLSSDLIDHKGSFQEQINKAFHAVFALGFDKIICIGNDCPGLDISLLRSVINELNSGKTILGPDRRGGIYLLGIGRKSWTKLLSSSIPWQEHILFDRLYSILDKESEVHVLHKLSDIHSVNEMRRSWLKGELTLSQLLTWARYTSTIKNNIPVSFDHCKEGTSLIIARQLRGPPSMII